MGLFNFNLSKTTPVKTFTEEETFSQIQTVLSKPIELPKPYESKSTDYVQFGQNNCFPLELLELRNSSAIHDAIIEAKTNLICGAGIIFDDNADLSQQFIIQNWKMIPFWRKLDRVMWLVTRDYLTFGYACYEVIYSMDKSRIVDMNWVDASRIVSGKKEEGELEPEYYYYSKDWKNIKAYPARQVGKWNPVEPGGRQLMFISSQENNMDYYSLPDYYSAIKWIKSDALMADYNMNAINQGFSPSIIFKFFKKPTPEERRTQAEGIKSSHGGTKNAGKAIIFYADSKETAPEIQTIDATNIDQRLIQVADQITQQIVTAHKTHPTLCGIAIAGKLGVSNELLQAWSIMNSMVIKPNRKVILDSFKEVLVYNGIMRIKVDEISPIEVINNTPQPTNQIENN